MSLLFMVSFGLTSNYDRQTTGLAVIKDNFKFILVNVFILILLFHCTDDVIDINADNK